MSTTAYMGQPPLPPKKFAKVPILQNFLKTSEYKGQSKLLRRYSLRKKHPDRFSCTYQSFSKDLYEGGEVVFRNASNSRFAGRFPYSDFSESTASLSRSRPNSVNSILTLSRSHSDGNLSCVSADDTAIFQTDETEQNFHTFRNTVVPCASINTSFTKYFRALSGSWKNLLNRKLCFYFF